MSVRAIGGIVPLQRPASAPPDCEKNSILRRRLYQSSISSSSTLQDTRTLSEVILDSELFEEILSYLSIDEIVKFKVNKQSVCPQRKSIAIKVHLGALKTLDSEQFLHYQKWLSLKSDDYSFLSLCSEVSTLRLRLREEMDHQLFPITSRLENLKTLKIDELSPAMVRILNRSCPKLQSLTCVTTTPIALRLLAHRVILPTLKWFELEPHNDVIDGTICNEMMHLARKRRIGVVLASQVHCTHLTVARAFFLMTRCGFRDEFGPRHISCAYMDHGVIPIIQQIPNLETFIIRRSIADSFMVGELLEMKRKYPKLNIRFSANT